LVPQTDSPILEQSILKSINRQFIPSATPAAIFTKLNRKIKKLTGVKDAFKLRKKSEIKAAYAVSKKLIKSYDNTFEQLLLLSVSGNSLDFFKEIRHAGDQGRLDHGAVFQHFFR